MARALKPETEIKNLRRDVKRCKDESAYFKRSALKIQDKLNEALRRASEAEVECAEWKARFDLLLSKAGIARVGGDDG